MLGIPEGTPQPLHTWEQGGSLRSPRARRGLAGLAVLFPPRSIPAGGPSRVAAAQPQKRGTSQLGRSAPQLYVAIPARAWRDQAGGCTTNAHSQNGRRATVGEGPQSQHHTDASRLPCAVTGSAGGGAGASQWATGGGTMETIAHGAPETTHSDGSKDGEAATEATENLGPTAPYRLLQY